MAARDSHEPSPRHAQLLQRIEQHLEQLDQQLRELEEKLPDLPASERPPDSVRRRRKPPKPR